MRRYDYVPKVLGYLSHLTPRERMAVRQELYAHIEDHMEVLMELGYDSKLAEERTMERMGDPEEVGRALNAQYPPGWLTLKRVAKGMAVVLAIVLLIQVNWRTVVWNLGCRINPDWVISDADIHNREFYAFLKYHPADVRVQVGTTMVRVYAAGVIPAEEFSAPQVIPEDTDYIAGISYCAYPASWRDLGQTAELPVFDIEQHWLAGSHGGSNGFFLATVESGEPSLTASYTMYGHDVSVDIPLDWEDVP